MPNCLLIISAYKKCEIKYLEFIIELLTNSNAYYLDKTCIVMSWPNHLFTFGYDSLCYLFDGTRYTVFPARMLSAPISREIFTYDRTYYSVGIVWLQLYGWGRGTVNRLEWLHSFYGVALFHNWKRNGPTARRRKIISVLLTQAKSSFWINS